MLGAEGLAANANYQNQVAANAQQQGIVNGLINTGVGVVNGLTSSPNPQQSGAIVNALSNDDGTRKS